MSENKLFVIVIVIVIYEQQRTFEAYPIINGLS